MEQIFFQSSLPRSGSTLLQNILAQNPDFYATPTSGVLDLLLAARHISSKIPEFKAQDSEVMKQAMRGYYMGGMEGYFKNITDKPYIIDKSRGWGVNYDFINLFYENPKVICMIRDPRDIYASMENNYRKNPGVDPMLVNPIELKNTTVEKRIDHFAANIPVGLAFERLQDMVTQKLHLYRDILFVKFEDLTENPQEVMNQIYDFLKIKRYNHDFNNIEQITQEDDKVHGIFGDHKLRPKVEPLKSKAIDTLGVNACSWIRQHYDWFYQEFKYY